MNLATVERIVSVLIAMLLAVATGCAERRPTTTIYLDTFTCTKSHVETRERHGKQRRRRGRYYEVTVCDRYERNN